MPMILVGCDGGTNASSGVVPELTRKLYDLTVSGQLDEARRIQYDLVTLFDSMLFDAEFPNGFRKAVDLRGFNMGTGRLPQPDSQRSDTSNFSAARCSACWPSHGFTGEPVGNCPVGEASAVDNAEVTRIVQTVVAELKRRGIT